MVSHKEPNASSITKIECESSIQTYATVKKLPIMVYVLVKLFIIILTAR